LWFKRQLKRRIRVAQALHSLRALATLYCAAHLLVIDDGIEQPDGGHGEVISQKVGELSTGYMPQSEEGRESFFATSSYGRTFLTLEKRSAYAMSVRVF